ncbi:hypothetical protein R3P38DRAFT_3225002 [Favolaschia claudopus]|uniref:Uncharacterized protein n=1 Tax=Favolaschia claudopus TaxID=2862362 RepID=A0AAV9ZUX1_9AGAR
MDVDIYNRTLRSERVDFSNYSAEQLLGVLSYIRGSEYYAGRTDILRIAGWGKGHERWKTVRAAVPTEPNTLPPVIPLIVVGLFEAQALSGGGSAGGANPEVLKAKRWGLVAPCDDEGFVGVQEECLRGVETIVSAIAGGKPVVNGWDFFDGQKCLRVGGRVWLHEGEDPNGAVTLDDLKISNPDVLDRFRTALANNYRLRDYVAFDVRGHRIPFSLLRSSLSGSIVMVTVSVSAISINKEINGVSTPAISLALEVMEVQVLRAPLKAAQELVHPAQSSIARILSTKPVQTQPPVNGWKFMQYQGPQDKVHKGGFVPMPNAPNDPSRSSSKLPDRVLQTPPVGHGQSLFGLQPASSSPDFTFDNVTQQDMALASRGKELSTASSQGRGRRSPGKARKGGGRPLNGAHARSTVGGSTSRRPTPSEPSNVLQLEDNAGHRMQAAVEMHLPAPRSPVKTPNNHTGNFSQSDLYDQRPQSRGSLHAMLLQGDASAIGFGNGNETVSVGDRQQVLAIFHRHGSSPETDACQISGDRDGRVEVARTRVYEDGQHPGSPFPGHSNIGNGIIRAPSSRHAELKSPSFASGTATSRPASRLHQNTYQVPANQRYRDVFSVDFSRDITRPSSQVPEEATSISTGLHGRRASTPFTPMQRSLDGTANDQAYRRTKLGNVSRDVDGYEIQGQMDAGSLQRNAVRLPSRIRDNAGIAVHSTGQSVQSMETAANITRPQSRVTRHSKRGHGEAGTVRSQSGAAAGDKVSNWSTELNDVNNEFAQVSARQEDGHRSAREGAREDGKFYVPANAETIPVVYRAEEAAALGIPGTGQVMSATGESNKSELLQGWPHTAHLSESEKERLRSGPSEQVGLHGNATLGTELFVSAMNAYNERNSLNPQGNDYLWTGESIYSKELNDATVKKGTMHDSGAYVVAPNDLQRGEASTHSHTSTTVGSGDSSDTASVNARTPGLSDAELNSMASVYPPYTYPTHYFSPTDGRAAEVPAFMENAMNLSPSSHPYGALWDIDFTGPLSVSLQDVQVTDIVKDDGHFGSYGADGVATDYSSGDTIYSSSSNSEDEYKLGRAGSSSSFEGSQSTSESSWESAGKQRQPLPSRQ